MDWKRLETFYIVTNAGSISKASKEMNISKGAVSRQISLLEEHVKTKLFHRHVKGLFLTQTGETLYHHVKTMQSEASMAEAVLSNSFEQPLSVLKISAPMILGSYWLAPLLKKFHDSHSNILIDLNLTDTSVDLSMGNTYVALRYPAEENPEHIRREIGTVNFYACATKSYLLQFGTPECIRDFGSHRLIAFRRNTYKDYKLYNWHLNSEKSTDFEGEAILITNSLYACYYAIKSGLGIGILPEYLIRSSDKIIKLIPFDQCYSRKLNLYYSKELRNGSKIKAFCDFISNEKL